MIDIDHVAICRLYANELLNEPAVSRCLRAGADEIERLTAEVERLRLVGKAAHQHGVTLHNEVVRLRNKLGGGE